MAHVIDKDAFRKAISESRRQGIESGRVVHVGRPHTDETKKILSDKARERMSDPNRNHFVGKKRSEESREKQSKTRSEKFVDGTYEWQTWTKGGHVDSKKGGRVFCRSSWEMTAVKILDEDSSVSKFEIEPLSIPYLKKEGDRTNLRHYIPDFLVEYSNGKKALIEVKPECFVDAEINLSKFVAAREFCEKRGWEFHVWTQKKLEP